MELLSGTIPNFLKELASEAPAPGGGSWAALSGALGVSLTAMVCSLTVGKEKYAQYDALAAQSLERAVDLQHRFVAGAEEDVAVFNGLMAVFALPRTTQEEKDARSLALAQALQACTLAPMGLMSLGLEALELTEELIGQSNPTAVSDLGCAALGLKSAIQGAWLNVCINLGSIKDEAFVAQYRQEGEEILARAIPLADDIYNRVLAAL